jgi:serine/threonine-protein kinase PknG
LIKEEHKEVLIQMSINENEDTDQRQAVINSVRSLLQPKEIAASRDDLLHASKQLRTVAPYNYDAWRLHADLLLTALRQLETREMQPDASFTLLAIPLREDDIRDAAEAALRQCATFAESSEDAVALIDEANRVRRETWF